MIKIKNFLLATLLLLLSGLPLYAQISKPTTQGIFHIQVYNNDQITKTGTGFFVDKQGNGFTHRDLFAGATSATIITADSTVHQLVSIVAEDPLTGLIKIAIDNNLTTSFTVIE